MRIKRLEVVARTKTSRGAASGRQTPIETVVLALDIGTVNIKALIARLKSGQLEVLGLGRAVQGLNDMQAGSIADIPAVVQNCTQALITAEQAAGYRPSQAVIGIAGELIKGITNTTRVERAVSDQPLDTVELDGVIKATQAQARKQAQQEVFLELGGQKLDLKLINSALIGISVDGYKVTNPIGFQGRYLETQLYTAFAPLVHTGAIERVARDLSLDLMAVAAEPFSIARSIIGDNPNASINAILIDVGGGTTDIAVLRDGGLEATRSFAIGGCSFSRSIARQINCDYDQAEAIKLAFSSGQGQPLSSTRAKAVERALSQTLAVWLEGIKMSFSEFSWLEYLPNQILLSGGGSFLKMLPQVLARTNWSQGLPFSRKPTIKSIRVSDIPGLDDQSGQIVDHTMITALGLARVASDTLETGSYGDGSSSIRRRVSQTLAN